MRDKDLSVMPQVHSRTGIRAGYENSVLFAQNWFFKLISKDKLEVEVNEFSIQILKWFAFIFIITLRK